MPCSGSDGRRASEHCTLGKDECQWLLLRGVFKFLLVFVIFGELPVSAGWSLVNSHLLVNAAIL